MLEFIDIFGKGWVGSAFGLIGILIAIYQTFKKSGSRPVFQYFGYRMFSPDDGGVGGNVEVLYKGTRVPSVSITFIYFWNDGASTIKGEDVVDSDPICISFVSGDILDIDVIKRTRDVIAPSVLIGDGNKSARIGFKFLDSQDGFLLRVIHTAKRVSPTLTGTIMGVPRGIKSYRLGNQPAGPYAARTLGLASGRVIAQFMRWMPKMGYVLMAIGLFFLAAGIFSKELCALSFFSEDKLCVDDSFSTRVPFLILGLMYIALGGFTKYVGRKRFPKALSLDE